MCIAVGLAIITIIMNNVVSSQPLLKIGGSISGVFIFLAGICMIIGAYHAKTKVSRSIIIDIMNALKELWHTSS